MLCPITRLLCVLIGLSKSVQESKLNCNGRMLTPIPNRCLWLHLEVIYLYVCLGGCRVPFLLSFVLHDRLNRPFANSGSHTKCQKSEQWIHLWMTIFSNADDNNNNNSRRRRDAQICLFLLLVPRSSIRRAFSFGVRLRRNSTRKEVYLLALFFLLSPSFSFIYNNTDGYQADKSLS